MGNGDGRDPAPPTGLPPHGPAVLLAVSLGGVLGALARYAVSSAWPVLPGALPASTLVINVVGCMLIGVLMVLAERGSGPALLRPFLGVGVLGGFTTFSAYAVEGRSLLAAGQGWVASAYLAGTVLSAVLATFLGVLVGRRVAHGWPRRQARPQ